MYGGRSGTDVIAGSQRPQYQQGQQRVVARISMVPIIQLLGSAKSVLLIDATASSLGSKPSDGESGAVF